MRRPVAVLVRLRPGKTELRDRWRYEIFSMMFSRFFSLHPSIGKKAPISRCKIGGSPPMRWPVSAHTSFNWLDTQRNSSGGCIGPLASELLGTWIGPDASMAIKHRCAWTSRANPAGLTNTIKLLRIRRELFDGRSKKPTRPKFAPCGSWWLWLFLSSSQGWVGTCGLTPIGFTGTQHRSKVPTGE